MKKYFLIFLLLIVYQCVPTNEFHPPELHGEIIPPETNTSIAAVRQRVIQSKTGFVQFPTDDVPLWFEAYVTSSDAGGNFYKEIYLQDEIENPKAALRFLLDETALNNLYPIGRKVYVNLNGLGAGYHRGVLTIGTYAADGVENLSAHLISAHLVRSSEDHLIIPLSINIEDFNQEYLGMWISINAVQFSNSELGKTFSAEGYDEFDGERRLVNCQTQQSIWVTTSTFSKFKSVVVSDHSGVISGILTRDYYNEKFILKINEPQNISFQDPRCDPFFNQHFENENIGKFESEGWISFTEEGTPYWKVVEDEYALGRSASFSAYSSGDTETIGWLITPPINASSINNPVFAFRTAVKYPDKSQLEVYFSNDFNGNIDGVLSAQWQKLALKIASKIDVSNAWIDSGEFELPAQSENIYFAFKYIGNGKSTYDATFLVDDIRVMEGNQ